MTVKSAVMDQLITDLIDHPEQHNQVTWLESSSREVTLRRAAQDCNTSACAAGWIVLRNAPDLDMTITQAYRTRGIGFFAGDLAGLSRDQAYFFFSARWSTDQVIAGAKFLKDNPDCDGRALQGAMWVAGYCEVPEFLS